MRKETQCLESAGLDFCCVGKTMIYVDVGKPRSLRGLSTTVYGMYGAETFPAACSLYCRCHLISAVTAFFKKQTL